MTPTEINKKCHEILGISWHERKREFPFRMCVCGVFDCQEDNADFFNDPVALLRELEKWKHGKLFFAQLMYRVENSSMTQDACIEAGDDDGYISRKYITTPGLLARKLVEWNG